MTTSQVTAQAGGGRDTVCLFGPTRVQRADGRVLRDVDGVRPRQLLELLALNAGTRISKDRLADELWSGRPPRAFTTTIETYVCVLRRAWRAGGDRPAPIVTAGSGYLLPVDRVRVDLLECERRLDSVSATADPVATVDAAFDLVSGELFDDDPCSAWALEHCDAFGQAVVRACCDAAVWALGTGRSREAERLGTRALSYDGLAERAWEVVIRAQASDGRSGDALATYARLQRRLADELGVVPGDTLRRLHLDLLQGTESDALEVDRLLHLLTEALSRLPARGLPPAQRTLAAQAMQSLGQLATA